MDHTDNSKMSLADALPCKAWRCMCRQAECMLSAASAEPSHARVQVHVYLPGKNHPAHDTVRAIVKDDTDTFTGDSSRVWVDSGAPLLM